MFDLLILPPPTNCLAVTFNPQFPATLYKGNKRETQIRSLITHYWTLATGVVAACQRFSCMLANNHGQPDVSTIAGDILEK